MTLPQGFLDEITPIPALEILASSLLTPPDISVRINPLKSSVKDLSGYDIVPWCETGVYLSERPKFTFDPKLHQGVYYVQDASSMAIYSVIKEIAKAPVKYLDACAAPGGKTTAAISALPGDSVVVANEYDYKRAEILVENIAKWGSGNVVVSRGDTSKLRKLKGYFDIVAVDAPCSGEGMMRKEPIAREQWSKTLVKQCAETQREILSNVWEALRPGGYLVYSTCTFNICENEDNLRWIIEYLGGEPVDIPSLNKIQSITPGIDCEYRCYRFLPGKIRGEGLFLAVVKKPGNGLCPSPKAKTVKPLAVPKEVSSWVKPNFTLVCEDNEIYALPSFSLPFIQDVSSKLDILNKGTHIASIKGRDVLPTHDLALSNAINTPSFVICEIDKDQALMYLRREAITLPNSTPKGIVLLTYENRPLGFVKNLGSRSNNLLPKNWRIRTSVG